VQKTLLIDITTLQNILHNKQIRYNKISNKSLVHKICKYTACTEHWLHAKVLDYAEWKVLDIITK